MSEFSLHGTVYVDKNGNWVDHYLDESGRHRFDVEHRHLPLSQGILYAFRRFFDCPDEATFPFWEQFKKDRFHEEEFANKVVKAAEDYDNAWGRYFSCHTKYPKVEDDDLAKATEEQKEEIAAIYQTAHSNALIATRTLLLTFYAWLSSRFPFVDYPRPIGSTPEELGTIESLSHKSPRVSTPRTILPAVLPQSTFLEARAFANALSDGRDGRNWREIEGTLALLHCAPKAPHSTRFEPNSTLLNWWGLPTVQGKTLYDELSKHDFDDILLFHVVLSGILHNEKARLKISLDNLIKLIGRDSDARRSQEARGKLRRKIWRSIVVFDSMLVFGTRPGIWKEPAPNGEKREKMDGEKLYSRDPLIRIVGTTVTEQGTFDGSEPPKEVSLTVGDWAMQFHGSREFLSEIGDILRLAEIPRGTPSGAFAANIALMLNQRWREEAARAERKRVTRHTKSGEEKIEVLRTRPFTRRELLAGMVRSDYDVEAMLRDAKSNYRVPEYWEAAIKKLKKRGDIGYYKELPKKPGETWQDEWLDRPLDIRATGETLCNTLTINRDAQTKKQRGRPRMKLKIQD